MSLRPPILITQITKGRCWHCNIVWYWDKKTRRRLKDTKCPFCGGPLAATTYYCKSAMWKELV